MPWILIPSPYSGGPYNDQGYGFFIYWFDVVHATINDIKTQLSNVPQDFSTAHLMVPSGYGMGGYNEGPYGFVVLDSTILGPVDGINKIFTISAYARRMRVFWNGVLQTQNYDVAVGGNSILFLRSTPNVGDTVTAEVWV